MRHAGPRGGFIGVHVRGVISLTIQPQFYSLNVSGTLVRLFRPSPPPRRVLRIFNAYRSGMSPSSSPLPVDSLASPSTRAEPLTPEELAALCNAQAVQLELYRSAALTAEAELMVLRLALGAADCDCACLQEAWLIAAEANLSARAALPSTIAEPTAQEAEPNLGSQRSQMEQLADACGRQASMQRREASASEARSERSSEALAKAESETRPACEARHGHRLLCGGEALPDESAAWPEPAAWVEPAPAEPSARMRRVPLGESDRSRLNTAVARDTPTAGLKAMERVTTTPEQPIRGTEEEVDWPVLETSPLATQLRGGWGEWCGGVQTTVHTV